MTKIVRFDEAFIKALKEASEKSSTGIVRVYNETTDTYHNIESIYVDKDGDIILDLYMDFDNCGKDCDDV